MRRVLDSAWAKALLFLVVLLALVFAVQRLSQVLTPFAVAFALAYFLNGAVNALEHRLARALARLGRPGRLVEPRTAAVALLGLFLASGVVAGLTFVVPAVAVQLSEAAAKLPGWARQARAELEPMIQRLSLRYPAEIDEARDRLQAILRDHWAEVLSPVTRFVQAAFSSVLGFVLALLNLIVIPVFVAYLLIDMNRIRDGIKTLVPHRLRPYVYSRAAAVDHLLAAFVRGQVTVCLILGSFYAIALTACGVPMGLLVGFVIGLFNLVPFMSTLLGLPLALGLSWLDDQSGTKLIVVAAVFAFGQFVEGNFVTPKIVGESLGLHAVVVMLAVLVGGTLLGLIGMLIAVPVTASLSVFWKDLRAAYLASDFYGSGEPPPEQPASAA
ncbi:MAG: AI-2E family transporter [Vicinamibacteria bacterium]